jgi:hypothetical protein
MGAIWGGKNLLSYYSNFREQDSHPASTYEPATPSKPQSGAASTQVRAEDLPGLPSTFEASLQKAQSQGAAAMKEWLRLYRAYASDPRLAWIELDYVILLSREDPGEARRVFQSVKSRVSHTSPVYERVKKLEKTYG